MKAEPTHRVRRYGGVALAVLGYGLAAALIAVPVAAEQAVERISFPDRLGTLPVEVSLCHNGVSTVDTGVLGKVYWDRTGPAGFGAYLRATGPPEAGGTLSSYVDPTFLRANTQVLSHPADVADAYRDQFVAEFWKGFLWIELLVVVVGGVVLAAIFRVGHPFPGPGAPRWRRIGIPALTIVSAAALSGVLAWLLYDDWNCADDLDTTYAMPGFEDLSFSSPQTREVAQQIQPFIEKNTERIREKGDFYLASAEASMRSQLSLAADGLAPREGEHVVIAEADPQGSLVGTDVRAVMYPLLRQYLGEGGVALRTISGDVTSNGTVAEKAFVKGEAEASGDIPTVAVKGDHDSDATVEQLQANGVEVPDLATVEVDGIRVAGASDPAFKSLFGGLISNESGVSQTEVGRMLRDEVDESEPVHVLLHQPGAALGYLGLDSMAPLRASEGHETSPWDDGVPDLPPGTVSIGHLHDTDGPWVLWNTGGDLVTWTVVDQLGTSGGVEERPTFNRFSTPFSAPLKTLSVRLHYLDVESGLQTGYATIDIDTEGRVQVTERVDVGLPGGKPLPVDEVVP
jgi:hypothetical protein